MLQNGCFDYRVSARDLAWLKLKHAILRLKRALDRDEPFDFLGRTGNGELLLVGEGNLSFSAALLHRKPQLGKRITATTFETETSWNRRTSGNASFLRQMGARVHGSVDATKLEDHVRNKLFELIVFQFPNVASRVPRYGRNPNHILIKKFLRSASRHLTSSGCVAVTVVNSSFYDGAFDMDGAAKDSGLEKPVAHPFFFADYPNYSHVNTLTDDSAIEKSADCVTFVFNSKTRRGVLETAPQ